MLRAALLAPVLVVAAILLHTFQAFPLLDDYGASLGFLLRQQALRGFSSKLLGVIADQQFQYKFLLLHFAIVAQRALTGHLSFVPLTVIGNLLYLPLLYSLVVNSFRHLPQQKAFATSSSSGLLCLPTHLCGSLQLGFGIPKLSGGR